MADPSDLFHHPHHFSLFSDSGSGSGSELDSEDPDFLALGFGLGLGLGLGFPNQEDDWASGAADAEDFFVGLRRGLVEIPGSDTDDEEQIVAIGPDPDPDPVPSLCWDCLRIDDEFEWEEVDAPRAAAASSSAGVAAFENPIEIQESDDELEEELAAVSNWEFLLTMHAFGNPPEEESYFVEDHDHVGELAYTSEYDEVLFDQFQEQERAAKGGPPAARSVVEALPTVALKAEEVVEVAAGKGKGSPVNCAVCKDEFSAEERVKKLPCCHYYHEECILPWLGMRNTCPLCRYELPTDDVEYESRKARRGSVAAEEEEERVRYDFEMLPEALDA